MIWPAARGGIRSVVESYVRNGFVSQQGVRLVESYREGGFLARQLVFAAALTRFAWLLATRRIELVHLHSAMKGSFWRKSVFASLARARGVPVIMHLHGSEMRSFYDRQPAWRRRLIARQLDAAESVLVLSESWRDFVRNVAPAANAVVVPNFVPLPSEPARGTGSPVTLLFLGLLGPRKGIFDLLDAFAAARRSRSDLRLVVGGNGQVAEANRHARELGLGDAVQFAGWVGPEAKEAWLRQADVYVLPSYNEGLPMSVLEAMAYGVPVITTDVGGLPELVRDGTDGLLVKPGDVPALTRAILTLALNTELRERMGAAARGRIGASYTSSAVLPKLATIYGSVARRAESH